MKGLFVGCNYAGTSNELAGCINDAIQLRSTFEYLYGLKRENTRMLLDNDVNRMPTKENILRGIEWLVTGNSPGEQLFLTYSGHGSQVRDRDGDEVDGMDEVIVPYDYNVGGCISDDELKKHLVDRIGNAYLFSIMDCCHSGTILDLNWSVKDGVTKQVGSNLTYPQLNCVLLSGCKDNQTSADTVENGKNCGALTWALNFILMLKPKLCFKELISNVHDLLKRHGYTQTPQLSFNTKTDVYDQVINF